MINGVLFEVIFETKQAFVIFKHCLKAHGRQKKSETKRAFVKISLKHVVENDEVKLKFKKMKLNNSQSYRDKKKSIA